MSVTTCTNTKFLLGIFLVVILHILFTWMTAMYRGTRARNLEHQDQFNQPSDWPFVSIVVPAWKERDTLEYCLHSLRALDYPHMEAIIVAGGPDGTYEAACASCANQELFQVVEQQPHGKNAALNQGIKIAKGEVLVLLDADSIMPPEWLKTLVVPLTESHPVVCGDFRPLRETTISLGMQMEQIATRGIEQYAGLHGAGGIALRREIIERLGKLPEDVFVGVDWDLNARLAVMDINCVFCPRAVLHTEIPVTLKDYWHTEVRWRRAHLASLFRHSGHFLSNPGAFITSLYIYILAWFTILSGLIAGFILFLGHDSIQLTAPILWLILVTWLLLRRSALVAAVATYTQQWEWLRLAWAPALLLSTTLVAIIPATLTLKKNQTHFKGPRHTQLT